MNANVSLYLTFKSVGKGGYSHAEFTDLVESSLDKNPELFHKNLPTLCDSILLGVYPIADRVEMLEYLMKKEGITANIYNAKVRSIYTILYIVLELGCVVGVVP